MRKIMIVIGTRPEAIKLAPVIKALRQIGDSKDIIVCSTGQHKQMLDQTLSVFDISADISLNIMTRDQTLNSLSSQLIVQLDKAIRETEPDWVVAQGDTTTVMASALASYHLGVKFGHVEAGLRSGDKKSPFPEEVNRKIADLLADACFAPTAGARDNLLKENVRESIIHLTGNTVVDALLEIASRPYDWNHHPARDRIGEKAIVLVTSHRRENIGAPLERICEAIRVLAARNPNYCFLFPVHLNPNVQKIVYESLDNITNVVLAAPLNYVDFVHTLKRSILVLTDSGGVQEEAPTFGIPALVLRDSTERLEGIDTGLVKVIGTDVDSIIESSSQLLNTRNNVEKTQFTNPYGDGLASQRIATVLREV